MNILHINIGRYPFFEGGSVLACEELMRTQRDSGHQVSLMYPGYSSIWHGTRLVKTESRDKIQLIEIINPLPVALMGGVKNPIRYVRDVKSKLFYDFFKSQNFNVIHVHSLMGIPKACFSAAKKMNIRMIFTTHDYYPMCSRCTFIDVNGDVCETHTPQKCALCNRHAEYSPFLERLFRSRTYRLIKHSTLMSKVRSVGRKSIRNSNLSKDRIPVDLSAINGINGNDYHDLADYYQNILDLMDVIHCNSELTKSLYLQYFPTMNYQVIPLALRDQPQKVLTRSDFEKEFRIGYVGGNTASKGIEILLKAFRKLPYHGLKWKLLLWGDDYNTSGENEELIESKGRYSKHQLSQVFMSMDVLVVPSIWYETFGLVVIEAISHGIPVICSDRVGAKILVNEECIFRANDEDDLVQKLHWLADRSVYDSVIDKLDKQKAFLSFSHYVNQIENLYKGTDTVRRA